jgi:hypothetical protein
VLLGVELIGGELADTGYRIRRRVRSDDPANLGAPLSYSVEVLAADDDPEDLDSAAAALSKSRQWVLAALRAGGEMQTVKHLGDRLAQAGHPLKPRTIQTALGELEAAGWPPGARKATAEPATGHRPPPIRMPTAPATVNRAMVGERAWHDPPGNVLDRGLAEPAHGTSHLALVRLVVTDLPTAPRKERPHERSASPREPGGLAAMLSEWST